MKWDKETKKTYSTDFQTPEPVCNYMMDLLPIHTISVLEPTPGQGNLVKALTGFRVTAPDDFFKLDPAIRYDAIVMNPPFSAKHAFGIPEDFQEKGMRVGYYFMLECMKRTNHVIALMPWFTITDSDIRLKEMMAYGLKSITALPRKTFGYSRIQTCIFELEKGYKGKTEFKTFNF